MLQYKSSTGLLYRNYTVLMKKNKYCQCKWKDIFSLIESAMTSVFINQNSLVGVNELILKIL